MRASSDRIYRALLRLYPPAFRAEFGGPMAQLFADQRRDASRSGRAGLMALWLRTLADILMTAAQEHIERILTMRSITLMVAALLLGLGIGWVDIHNSEIWAGFLLLLTASCLLGFFDPRSAWRSGLLIGAGMLLVHLGSVMVGFASPCHPGEVCPPPSFAIADLLFLAPPLVGAYIGVGIRALSSLERGDLVWWAGSALVGLAVALLGMRTSAVGNTIMVVGLLGLLAGFTRPSNVWRWALALSLVAGVAHGWGELINDPPNVLLKFFLADVAPAFMGAYLGFALRWLLDKVLPLKNAEPQPAAG